MQATLDQSHSASSDTQNHWVSLGQNHGYRFEGDTAILNAELAIEPLAGSHERERAEHWALQLWACDAPHQGGPLQGIKVAEAALALPYAHERDYLETAAFAQLPPAQRAYSMVLVLASGTGGAYDQVHDFSNYPARQEFAAPHLDGSVGYRFEDDAVVLQAEGVRNPRDVDNISGSLSLELWALRAPYVGGAFEGVLLGSAELERLEGQSETRGIERRVSLAQAPAGEWQLALMLREWTEAAGYLTRDFCNFANAYRVESTHGAEPNAVQSWLDVRSEEPAVRNEEPALRNEQPAARSDEAAARSEEPAVRNEVAAARNEVAAARSEEPAEPTELWAEQPAVSVAAAPADEPVEDAPLAATTSESVSAAAPAAPVAEPVAVVRPEPAATPSQVASPVVEAPSEAGSKVGKTATSSRKPATTAARATPSASKKPAADAAAPAAGSSRVSVQTGSIDDLAAVPGLNKKVAAAIVRARPFASLDDLRRVRGIGDKMLQQLRSALTL